ncbi:thiosulfate oxidation carrier protein SoxY [Roseomonas alkaliterrae]|uniref:Sulfur-oxidizing protein SoxY n=1 Tax=Neoroseomonas alkaliterrae TaxID=1452450 RepID=A0A840XT96_9PROT|nr:thiosulfate oxidation carrier protein SoxY [Neoroseomonas alkaliterrae]MBB5690190.1 sulfur-oxidizing protein SoxY [Neoroseomonas alkaliterrae]MBR0674778.1 thiosulfate oxidation carrier protein SoxY [Neoroseomonas alkaliterrae]
MSRDRLSRRDGLALAAGLVGLSLLPRAAAAEMPAAARAALDRVLAGRAAEEGGITLRLPAIAENGNSVPMAVIVDSPMTAADHIRTIHVFADRNPTPEVALFRLTPAMGRAQVETRIRLGETQDVIAVAETSTGRLMIGRAEVKVTIGGCGG